VKASSGRIIKSSCGSRGTFVRGDVAWAMFCWTAPSEGDVWRMAMRMRGGRNAREIKESVVMDEGGKDGDGFDGWKEDDD
jgi:hypothetical protein